MDMPASPGWVRDDGPGGVREPVVVGWRPLARTRTNRD